MDMRKNYVATCTVDGLKVIRSFGSEEMASMWLRMMTAQYLGRISAPGITLTCVSEIFNEPMTPAIRGGNYYGYCH